jgi:hypothetical protein
LPKSSGHLELADPTLKHQRNPLANVLRHSVEIATKSGHSEITRKGEILYFSICENRRYRLWPEKATPHKKPLAERAYYSPRIELVDQD